MRVLCDSLPLLCMKLNTYVGVAADRDASPACLNHLPSSHTYTHTHTDMHTNVHMQADNRRLAFVTQEVCSLSPDLTTNQVDNYANRLYFSHVASSFFLSSAAKGCVSSSLCVYVCSLLRHKTVLTVSSKPNLVCLHNFEAAVIQ